MWQKINVLMLWMLLMTHSLLLIDGKRLSIGSRKSSSGGSSTRHQSSSGHVTKPSYSSSGSAAAHDPVKLSYPTQNAHPGSVNSGHNPPLYGWTQPKQQGPPPAYSASNPVGGAKTNMHESPPAYHGNNAYPPGYAHTPLTATHTHGVQSGYPQQLPAGATYHSPGSLPAGATYYPSGGHLPAGASHYPAGSHYPASGHYPAGGSYYPSAGAPPGATYLPAGAALPPGATYYSQPPSSSSGLGFGSGLAAGAIGGAILGHVLTPTHTQVQQAPPAASNGESKIIIINNGQVETTGATGLPTTNVTAAPGTPEAAAPLAPLAPMNPMIDGSTTENNMASTTMPGNNQQPAPPAPPAPGGIICVPVRINETDPTDSAKMIEVEKIACYPAPPPPPPEAQSAQAAAPGGINSGQSETPLAPMNSPPMLPENSPIQKSVGNSLKLIDYSTFTFAILCFLSTIDLGQLII